MTLGGAIVALEAKEVVYGAIGLAGSLFGVAALFFLLDAPYVAVFQIAVYIGAVAVLILFTVMLVREERWAQEAPPTSLTRVGGALTGLAITLALAAAAVLTYLALYTTITNSASFVYFGKQLSTVDWPVLLALALVLAASVVGALTLARVDREERGK